MATGTHDAPNFRILLVDDNEDNLLLLSEVLDDEGYDLVLAMSGAQALTKARLAQPDLILLDLRMPGIDGHETCRRLKADPELRDAPVLFLSATDSLDDRLEGFAAGAVDFISKPFHGDEVIARVRTHLEIARLTRELSDRNDELEREIEAARAFRRDQLATMLAPLRGEGVQVRRLREQIEACAATSAAVLLTGTLADGAEAAARAIHEASDRGWRPFVRVQHRSPPVGAELGVTLPTLDAAPTLIEYIRLANEGTLYIEHVELLGEEDRATLRGLVEVGRGRLIAHWERHPETEFEPDWLRDIAWSQIEIPALADRREDIPVIVSWLLEAESNKLGKSPPELAEGELERLRRYAWPGGLAELELVVRRALVHGGTAPIHLTLDITGEARHLGRYVLQRVLGKGGMGEVWEARHDLLPHPVAIKIIAPELTGERLERAKQRFAREAFAIASLRSPYTVQIFDFGASQEGELYYAMELLEGLDLHTLVDTEGPLSPARTIWLMRQAASSLAEAHARGLVHRDIKPANLIVANLGAEPDWLKVVDFGIVTVEGGFEDDLGGGTPGFVAPEIINESGHPTAASDIYSLGCTMYWCIAGDEVFLGDDTDTLLQAHVEQSPPSLVMRTELPDELDELVTACLAKRAHRRPSAAELVAWLEELGQKYPWTREEARSWWAARE